MSRTDGRDVEHPTLADAYVAIVSESQDGTSTCSTSPLPTTADSLDGQWMLARGGAFVSRAEMR